MQSLYDQMIDSILDQNTSLTDNYIKNIYRRIQLLSTISISNQQEIKKLEVKFRELTSTLPSHHKLDYHNTVVIDCR